MAVEKINSVDDFSARGLGELKAWLEPWFQGRAEAVTETTVEGGSGIMFDTSPQEGGFLEITTTADGPTGDGINLAANDNIHLETTDSGSIELISNDGGGVQIDSFGGGGTLLREQGDGGMIISSNGGGLSIDESSGGLSIQGGGGLFIYGFPYGRIDFGYGEGISISPQVGDTLRLHHIPTSDPGVTDAVWNDSGTLMISL